VRGIALAQEVIGVERPVPLRYRRRNFLHPSSPIRGDDTAPRRSSAPLREAST
jgi:hypothetical protein